MIGEAKRGAKFEDGDVKDCKGVLLKLGMPHHPTDPNLIFFIPY